MNPTATDVYAAAHDCKPSDVEPGDEGLEAVEALLAPIRALLVEAVDVLRNHMFTSVDQGEYTESYNNDDVIDLIHKITGYLREP